MPGRSLVKPCPPFEFPAAGRFHTRPKERIPGPAMTNGTQTPIVVICPLPTCPWIHVGYSMGGDDNTAAEVADLVGMARTTLREELIEHLKRHHGEATVRDSLWPQGACRDT